MDEPSDAAGRAHVVAEQDLLFVVFAADGTLAFGGDKHGHQMADHGGGNSNREIAYVVGAAFAAHAVLHQMRPEFSATDVVSEKLATGRLKGLGDLGADLGLGKRLILAPAHGLPAIGGQEGDLIGVARVGFKGR